MLVFIVAENSKHCANCIDPYRSAQSKCSQEIHYHPSTRPQHHHLFSQVSEIYNAELTFNTSEIGTRHSNHPTFFIARPDPRRDLTFLNSSEVTQRNPTLPPSSRCMAAGLKSIQCPSLVPHSYVRSNPLSICPWSGQVRSHLCAAVNHGRTFSFWGDHRGQWSESDWRRTRPPPLHRTKKIGASLASQTNQIPSRFCYQNEPGRGLGR